MATSKTTNKPEKVTFKGDDQLQSLKPKAQRYEAADLGCPGLRVRIQPTGSKSFIWYFKNPKTGRQAAKNLGPYPAISLEAARAALTVEKDKLEHGDMEADDIPATVGQLCERWYAMRIVNVRRAPQEVRRCLDNDILPAVGKRRLIVIKTPHLTKIVEGVVTRGAAVHAGKVLAVIKQVFRYAHGMGYIAHNPAASMDSKNLGVKAGGRDRALDVDTDTEIVDPELPEIRAFWAAVDAAPKMSLQTRTALKLLLILGVRSGELRQATWRNLDLKAGILNVPVEHQKLNPDQAEKAKLWRVPLPDMAIMLLHRLHDETGELDHVFAGRVTDEGHSRPLSDKVLGRAMRRLFEPKADGKPLLDIDLASPHDLRRTMRTHLGAIGVDDATAERCLHHSLGKIAKTYNRGDYLDQRRQALQKWADRLDLAINPRDNVRRIAS